MDTHHSRIRHITNGLRVKSTPKSITDLPDEILILIGYKLAAISIGAWLNLVSSCRRLRQIMAEGQDFWRVLASSKLRLPYWWRGIPKPGCVYGHHKLWKSAYIAIRKQVLPFLDCVYVLRAEALELDPALTHVWTFIKLFKNGTFVRSELKTKSPSRPRKPFNGTVEYGEWRLCENKLVLAWIHRHLMVISSFKIRHFGNELVEVGRTSGQILAYSWEYFFEDSSKFSIPLSYSAIGGIQGDLSSHETAAARRSLSYLK